MNKDKEYIVNVKVDVELTEDEKRKLKQKSKPVGDVPVYGRQNAITDRRDPHTQKKMTQAERRKNKRERRDLDPA